MTVAFCHSDREAVFASTRNLVVTLTRKDSSVTQSSFKMTVACCHSDREVFYFDEESRCHSDREVFLSDRKLTAEEVPEKFKSESKEKPRTSI
jgi:hypothetical protein